MLRLAHADRGSEAANRSGRSSGAVKPRFREYDLASIGRELLQVAMKIDVNRSRELEGASRSKAHAGREAPPIEYPSGLARRQIHLSRWCRLQVDRKALDAAARGGC